jgi:macrolide-specific efflux system membrane fusion protein
MKINFFAISTRRARKWWLTGIAVVLLLAVPITLLWWFRVPSRPPVHQTILVSRADIEDSVLASGVLHPIRQVDVGAQVSGQLKRLLVRLGDRVVRDQLLAEIDSRLVRSDLQIARADLAVLQAELSGQKAKCRLADEERSRQNALYAAHAGSERDWQRARAHSQEQLAAHDSLLARISKARHAIAQQQARLTYTRITAPLEGEVLEIATQAGQTVIAAQQAPKIMTLGDLSRMEVRAQVSEADIGRIRLGQRAYFYLLGSPQQRYYGVVREIQPSPEKINNAMFFHVLFDVDNAARNLRLNMTAMVVIVLSMQSNALVLPLAALGAPDADGRYRVRVLADGLAQERRVQIGLKSRTHAQILSGLSQGDAVLGSADLPDHPPTASGGG